MAFFSQDLFEVFDEKSEPVSLSGKKRKRSDFQEGKKQEEQKKFRPEAQGGSSSSDATATAVVEERQSKSTSEVIDLTKIDESDTKDVTV